MKLTFAVLFACWTIYSSNRAVLSLPPSLIANAASLQHQQYNAKLKRVRPASTEDLNTLWHKDVAEQRHAANNEGGSIVPDTIVQRATERPWNSTSLSKNHEYQRAIRMAEISSSASAHYNPQQQRQRQLKFADKTSAHAADAVYDLNGYLQGTKTDDETSDNIDDDDTSPQSLDLMLPLLLPPQKIQQTAAPLHHQSQTDVNEFFTPLKYWARHCQPDRNCPEQYYRALFANRNSNKAAAAFMHPNGLNMNNEIKNLGGVDENVALALSHDFNKDRNSDFYDDNEDIAADDNYATKQKLNNDIFMFLNGEQDLIKFLRWAMHLLYSNKKFANNNTSNAAEHYHPGMYIWKKLNLSGNLEPPLFAEEPRYIIVRREQLNDQFKMRPRYTNNDPFIPPRGRKHNMLDLDALMHRYDTFIPNRGRRDKIKDLLKSTDLFFPNRGKKQKSSIPSTMKRDLEYENGSNKYSNYKTEPIVSGTSSNDVDIVESKSFNNNDDYNDDNDGSHDWNKALPVAILMRDVLEKLLQEKLKNQKIHRQTQAAGNKITTNAHEINYFDDNDNNNNINNPEWLQTMLNYKFNGYDPSVKQSMPAASAAAMAINGETREMSTPQKVAAKDHALQQLLKQQLQRNSVDDNDDDEEDNDDNDETANSGDNVIGIIGVDRGGIKIAANRLLSTRSMSTAMAHRRQQQEQQQQQLKHRQNEHLTTLSKEPSWQSMEKDQKQHHHHHQVKSFTNSEPLLWRQLQLLQQEQQKPNREHQKVSWPQETWISQRNDFDSPYAQSYTRGTAISGSIDDDYNYADI